MTASKYAVYVNEVVGLEVYVEADSKAEARACEGLNVLAQAVLALASLEEQFEALRAAAQEVYDYAYLGLTDNENGSMDVSVWTDLEALLYPDTPNSNPASRSS